MLKRWDPTTWSKSERSPGFEPQGGQILDRKGIFKIQGFSTGLSQSISGHQNLYCSAIWVANLYFILFCEPPTTKGWEPLF